jgi:hypothetical protein
MSNKFIKKASVDVPPVAFNGSQGSLLNAYSQKLGSGKAKNDRYGEGNGIYNFDYVA